MCTKLPKEQHPLLEDDNTEEELENQSQKKNYNIYYLRNRSGRAKLKAKGASMIMARWPDYWASSLSYLWIALGIITLIIFTVYNCVAADTVIPSVFFSSRYKEPSFQNREVFINIIVEEDAETKINKYLPFIEKLANNYPINYYNFIILFNDTYDKNRNALRFLHSFQNKKYHHRNINIERRSLSYFLDDSPLKTSWHNVPSHFMNFLVQAISIWEKGGIAFDPVILTSSVNTEYKQILSNLLKDGYTNTKIGFIKKEKKRLRKVNNIRDIIDSMLNDNHDNAVNTSQNNLIEAENKITDFLKKPNFRPKNIMEINQKSKDKEFGESHRILHQNTSRDRNNYRNNIDNSIQHNSDEDIRSEGFSSEKYDKIEIIAMQKNNKSQSSSSPKEKVEVLQGHYNFTIDLNGKLISTPISCHAFLGTVFSNIHHHKRSETLQDLIMKELKIFCNGDLAYCPDFQLFSVE